MATVPDVPHLHDHHSSHPGPGDLAALLDLDAAVLGGYLDDLIGWAAALAPDGVRTVVDLGAGPGRGTVALARRADLVPSQAVQAFCETLLEFLGELAEVGGLVGDVQVLARAVR